MKKSAAGALALQPVNHREEMPAKPVLLAILEDGVGVINKDEGKTKAIG